MNNESTLDFITVSLEDMCKGNTISAHIVRKLMESPVRKLEDRDLQLAGINYDVPGEYTLFDYVTCEKFTGVKRNDNEPINISLAILISTCFGLLKFRAISDNYILFENVKAGLEHVVKNAPYTTHEALGYLNDILTFIKELHTFSFVHGSINANTILFTERNKSKQDTRFYGAKLFLSASVKQEGSSTFKKVDDIRAVGRIVYQLFTRTSFNKRVTENPKYLPFNLLETMLSPDDSKVPTANQALQMITESFNVKEEEIPLKL